MNGSIRRRGKNSWELTVDLGHDSNGKRRRKFVNVRGKKADAERRLRELITQVEGGVSLDSSKVTVAEFLERWLFDYAETNTSPRTVQGYHGMVQRYLVPKFGTLALAKLTPPACPGPLLRHAWTRLVRHDDPPRTSSVEGGTVSRGEMGAPRAECMRCSGSPASA